MKAQTPAKLEATRATYMADNADIRPISDLVNRDQGYSNIGWPVSGDALARRFA